jgi:hypothetical protein
MVKVKQLPPHYVILHTYYLVCCDCRDCKKKNPDGILDHMVCDTQREAIQRIKKYSAQGHDACYIGECSLQPRVSPQLRRKLNKRKAA